MIVKVKGFLEEITPFSAVIENQGISYELSTTLSVKDFLHEKINQQVEVFVRQLFAENSQALYGFSSSKERALFDFLRTLPGLGPSLSMNIISTWGADRLLEILHRQEVTLLLKVPGIGKSKAEKIMFEVNQKSKKIQELMLTSGECCLAADISFEATIHNALAQLGFQTKEIEKARKKLEEKTETDQKRLPEADEEHLQEWIRLYLAEI